MTNEQIKYLLEQAGRTSLISGQITKAMDLIGSRPSDPDGTLVAALEELRSARSEVNRIFYDTHKVFAEAFRCWNLEKATALADPFRPRLNWRSSHELQYMDIERRANGWVGWEFVRYDEDGSNDSWWKPC